MERRNLTATQRGGVSVERVRLPAGRGAQDSAQTAADASYDGGGCRAAELFSIGAVGDRGAVAVESAVAES